MTGVIIVVACTIISIIVAIAVAVITTAATPLDG